MIKVGTALVELGTATANKHVCSSYVTQVTSVATLLNRHIMIAKSRLIAICTCIDRQTDRQTDRNVNVLPN